LDLAADPITERPLLDGHLRVYRLDPAQQRAGGGSAGLKPIIVTLAYIPPKGGAGWGKQLRPLMARVIRDSDDEIAELRQTEDLFAFTLAHTNAPDRGCDVELVTPDTADAPLDTLQQWVSLAEAATADGALASLQARLDSVRQALQQLGVRKLEVTSPSTWTRSPELKKPALTTASLQVSGELAPAQLQRLIRQVGSLPGVRLSPVDPRAQTSGDAASQARLLKAAYGNALGQAKTIAAAIGLHQLRPLEVDVEGGGGPPILMRAMASPDRAPFDPAELPEPVDRLSLLVRFCAR
jgi:hypothetical protein